MLQGLIFFLRHLVYKNRRSVGRSSTLILPPSSEKRLKKTRIKLGGKNNQLIIGENVELTHCEIRLDGENNVIRIDDDVRLSSGKIYLRYTSGQSITIGAKTTIEGAYLLVDEPAGIHIGKDCMFSTDIIIRAGDKHSILDATSRARLNPARTITIHDRVWLGRDVQILKGTVLLPETVVATRSLVSRAFDEGNCVIAGIPAKIIKRGIVWDRALL